MWTYFINYIYHNFLPQFNVFNFQPLNPVLALLEAKFEITKKSTKTNHIFQ